VLAFIGEHVYADYVDKAETVMESLKHDMLDASESSCRVSGSKECEKVLEECLL
jgi:hypothetical protein